IFQNDKHSINVAIKFNKSFSACYVQLQEFIRNLFITKYSKIQQENRECHFNIRYGSSHTVRSLISILSTKVNLLTIEEKHGENDASRFFGTCNNLLKNMKKARNVFYIRSNLNDASAKFLTNLISSLNVQNVYFLCKSNSLSNKQSFFCDISGRVRSIEFCQLRYYKDTESDGSFLSGNNINWVDLVPKMFDRRVECVDIIHPHAVYMTAKDVCRIVEVSEILFPITHLCRRNSSIADF
ncbi:hypothetical protein PENTCL1PPCAC_12120, partial [Pristionchus entomophagus]